ncbi:mitochondrial cardiolipin hydrolase [Pezoporus flaviventris]|uniref:mitochondrial cardiolipin hydrolase n=1 Tax=Pezoporus flaviventris TaxID=889875 RepID=UPI002AB3130D|nr:mitochondrial cardiolipin hydrolase [Pezoporus flaviventris]
MWVPVAAGRRGLTVAIAAAAAGLALAMAALRWRRRPVREVLFFPSQPSCTEALLAEAAGPGAPVQPCPCPLPRSDCSLSRLLRRLLSARRSLDICLFAFSCPQLGLAVRLLHRRGVRVRVVTDAQYMALRGSQIGLLRLAGIQVRHDQGHGYMHHKFAIVDRRMLITGSLNWTTQAIQTNRENVLVVEDAEYVKLYLDEFERIWEEYSPTNNSSLSQGQ